MPNRTPCQNLPTRADAINELCRRLEQISPVIAAATSIDSYILKALLHIVPDSDNGGKARLLDLTSRIIENLTSSVGFTREGGALPPNDVIAGVIVVLSRQVGFLVGLYSHILEVILILPCDLDNQLRELLARCALEVKQSAAGLGTPSETAATDPPDHEVLEATLRLHSVTGKVLEMHANTFIPLLPEILGPTGTLDPAILSSLEALRTAGALMEHFAASTRGH